MTLILKVRQNKREAEYDDRAMWIIHVACLIIHVSQGRLAMPQDRRGAIEARHFIFPGLWVAVRASSTEG